MRENHTSGLMGGEEKWTAYVAPRSSSTLPVEGLRSVAWLKIGKTTLYEALSGVSPRSSGCAIYPSKAYAE